MRKLFSKLWKDDDGVVTLEYLVLATILGLGVIVGVTAVTNALNTELSELAGAISGLNQDYTSAGFSSLADGHYIAGHEGSFADEDMPTKYTLTDAGSDPNNINVVWSSTVNRTP